MLAKGISCFQYVFKFISENTFRGSNGSFLLPEVFSKEKKYKKLPVISHNDSVTGELGLPESKSKN